MVLLSSTHRHSVSNLARLVLAPLKEYFMFMTFLTLVLEETFLMCSVNNLIIPCNLHAP